MPATRGHAVPTFGNPRPRRRQLRHRQRKDQFHLQSSTAPMSGVAMRTVWYSAGGYLLTLGVGRVAAMILASGESYAGLGLASLTAATLAPLAAVIGAMLGALPHHKLRLTGRGSGLSTTGFGVAASITFAAWAWVGPLSAVTFGLLALTASLILRAGLLERANP